MAGSEARALAPLAAELAERCEAERRLVPELVQALVKAGLFRLCVPASLGGAEAPPAELARAVEELARGDAAPAWCVAVAATSGMLAAYLPEEAAREAFGRGEECHGGVFAPKGRAVPEDGGYRVTGRWPFASGIDHCAWLMGGCMIDGGEGMRLMLFPAAEVERIDTWDVAGLSGTGSHDMAVDGVFVPESRSASLFEAPREQGPLYAFPVFGLLATAIAAVGLGIARGALDDLVGLAAAKTPSMSSRKLAERAGTQSALAQAEAELRAARAFLHEAIETAWQGALEGTVDVEQRTGLRLAASHAMAASARATDAAYTLAGGSAIYSGNPLQRRFRDVHVATQHMLVGPATWELAGRLLLGLPTATEQL